MANYMIDGPLDFSIEGDRVVIRGTSDGAKVAITLSIADALISRHRFNEAYESRVSGEVVQVDFGSRDQADTA